MSTGGGGGFRGRKEEKFIGIEVRCRGREVVCRKWGGRKRGLGKRGIGRGEEKGRNIRELYRKGR